jgi:glucose/arabinose dehydrogenase
MHARAASALIAAALLAAPAGAGAQGYEVPPDNPFVSTPGARGEVYVSGMRNPYRWSFDRQTGDMIVADPGGNPSQNDYEEVTFIPRAATAGANLGWNCYSGPAVESGCTPQRYRAPSYWYPSGSDVVIGGYVVRDPTLPSFTGRYLFARFNLGVKTLSPGATPPEADTAVDTPQVSGFGEDGVGRLYMTVLTGSVQRLTEPSPGVLGATPIAGSFTEPVAVGAAPGDTQRLFIVEQPGRVQLRTGTSVTQFLDITALVNDSAFEEGLLAFAVAPDYATSGRVFAYYTDNAGNLQLDEFTRTASGPDRSNPSTRKPLLSIPHQPVTNHNGGQLLFGPDGYLYLSTGDGGVQGDPEGDAQNLGSLLGKIIRIDVYPGAAPAPPLPDTTAPALRVRVKRRQRVLRLRGAIARVRCSERCKVTARGRLRIGRRSLAMRRTSRALKRGRRARIKVKLTRRRRQVLGRALRRGRKPSVRLTLRASDAAGNRSPLVRRKVRVRR